MANQSETPEAVCGAETARDGMGKVDGYDSYGLAKSRYDELSIPRTLWVFRRIIFVSLAVYTGYICEGFEASSYPALHDIAAYAIWVISSALEAA